MKRLLRMLLITVIALPTWFGSAAQEINKVEMPPQTLESLTNPGRVGSENVVYPTSVKTESALDEMPQKFEKGRIMPKAIEPVVNESSTYVCYDINSNLKYDNKLPFFGRFFDVNGSETQMIYPESKLSGLAVGDTITGFRYYVYDAIPAEIATATFQIRVGKTTNSSISNANQMISNSSGLTLVYEGRLTEGAANATIIFDTPFVYEGGNLMVDILVTEAGNSTNSCWWICDETALSNTSYYYCNDDYYNDDPTCNSGSNRLPSMLVWYKRPLNVEVNPRDVVVKPESFFEGISYAWPYNADPSQQTTSKLSEIATDPDQMIAMIREVYMDKSIPGNMKRGFAFDGTPETDNNDVYYSGVGTILLNNANDYSNLSSYEFDENGLGWGIPGELDNIKSGTISTTNGGSLTAYFTTTKQDTYTPDEEGLTLLLVEIKDSYKDGSNNAIARQTFDNEYERLRAYFANTVKSVRVVSSAKRTGDGFSSGTLFKIDCDKMNKFFLLAKGQLHLDHQASWYFRRLSDVTQDLAANDLSLPPSYIYLNSDNNQFYHYNSNPLFYRMFEQFSPSMPSDEHGAYDLYQNLKDMESFPVIHDCLGITTMNHQFMMYGSESIDDDCQDVRDLMFFIPDYRMLASTNRDPSVYLQQYLNYHTEHQPQMGLFVIKQFPITGEQIDNQETYKLHLTWTSNLLDFLPGEQGQYTLYRVITNADGTKTYQAVGDFDPNTFEYYDNVPMNHTGQQVTYVVQGQDVGKFLSLQMSNEESYIIPGLDHAEQLRIALNNDYYYSRYDAADQTNNYSNSLIANNTIGTNVKPEYIKNGSQFKFWRATIDEQGNVVTLDDPFVVAEVSNWDPATGGTLTYKEWKNQTDFSSKPYGHGYHANVTTSTISVTNGEVVFDGLKLYDNFSVSVEENTHPSQYVYYVTLETAEPFGLNQSLPSVAAWQDNKIFAYFEALYNDWYEVRAYAWDGDDMFAGAWAGTEMTWVGTHDGKNVYQWSIPAHTNGALPANIIFSWKDGYHNFHQTQNLDYSNGGYYTITDVNNSTGGLVATTSADNTSNQARSNTVSVPVYKTEMAMKPISAQDVEDDVTHQIPAATKFEVKTRYSSRSEILGYYIYRWADSDPEQPRTIYESDGEDSSPQGQAGNQGEYYTVAMNNDFTSRTENFGANYADVTASFEDNYVVNDAEDGDTYTYAPVVELFAPVQAVNLPSGTDRVDYNTYGGPQQMTAGGIVDVSVVKPAPSEYSWIAGGKTYRYYDVYLKVNVLDLPEGYEVAKVRAWRKIDSKYLGEQEATQNTPDYTGRLELDANGEYKFIDKAECQKDEYLGDDNNETTNVNPGTFGAIALEQGDEIPMSFVVRVYFTKSQRSGVPMLKAENDQRYYIMETKVEDELTYQISTGIDGVEVMSNVVSKKYYNAAGIESDKPFQGVNIVVTRYSDDHTTTKKIIK